MPFLGPTPQGERWRVDLRWAGFGRYVLRAPATPDAQIEAIHEAYELLGKLRATKLPDAQRDLPLPEPGAGPLLSEAIRLFKAGRERERMTDDNRRYVFGYLDAVDRELGSLRVAAFGPPHGDALLEDYRNRLADQGLSPKTRRNRLNTLMQVLKFCHGRGWLPALPVKPEPTIGREVVNEPVFDWYTEADFRALRDALYASDDPALRRWHPDRDERADYVARRRLYLSVGFYTGMHTADLDRLNDRSLNPTFGGEYGVFERVNTKSAACVPPKPLPMPEQLCVDAETELRRLGRRWHVAEAIAGGRWPESTRLLRDLAVRLQLPPRVNFRIFRRSTVYHLCLLGWPEEETSEYLGHVDREMVNSVYRRVPLAIRSRERLDWTNGNLRTVLGGITARARVLKFAPPPPAAPAARGRKDSTSGA